MQNTNAPKESTTQYVESLVDRARSASIELARLALKFQSKAKASGKKVVGVRTFAGDKSESANINCVCLAGGMVVRSTIKATYK